MPPPAQPEPDGDSRQPLVGCFGEPSDLCGALRSTGLRVLWFASSSHDVAADRIGTERTEWTKDCHRLGEPDAILLGAPVALTSAGGADLAVLANAARTIVPHLRAGQLVVLTSAAPPGTAREVVLPMLSTGGLTPGRDFRFASAVRVHSGAVVVGGWDHESCRAAAALFERAGLNVTVVSSLEAAEVCGLLGGAIDAVHVALVNELKVVCERLNADAWEVLEASGEPTLGPTPGGSGTESFLLAWGARRAGVSTRLLDVVTEINGAMPTRVVAKVTAALNDTGKAVRGSNIAILGVANENDASDPGGSPSVELLDLLLKKGATVSYNDPHVPSLPPTRCWPTLEPMASTPLTPEYLTAQDCVLIVTDHTVYDYTFIVEHSRLVIDTRNATRAVTHGQEKIVRA